MVESGGSPRNQTEGYARDIASGHGDPEHLWKGLGLEYIMDGFQQDVKAAMLPKQLYRIWKSWEDTQSQIGAYQSKSVAILMCRPGYNVYDINGTLVYSMPEEQEDIMTKEQILTELGDQYIARFEELSEWAKPEVRPLLDAGYIRGTDADDPDDIGMFMSDIRTIIVCARMNGGLAAEFTNPYLTTESGGTVVAAWDIAKKYLGNGSRRKEIYDLSGLTSQTIYAGQKLKIPD